MKILIIGSKGFIGSHCTNYLESKGHLVIGCDVLADKTQNYYCFKDLENDFNALFRKYSFDCCINAAGSANVGYSFEFPEKDFELNVSLVTNLLGAIKNSAPLCKFINFSSAAVYGNPTTLPIHENEETNPLSPYGYHKLLSEKLLYEYFRFFNLNTCSLRIFSAYGEGLKKQLFWDLYLKSKGQDSVKLFGTGNESRDFIYVLDLVKIVELVIHKASFQGEVYNVANGEEISVKEAANLFYKNLGWKGKIEYTGEAKTGDPINWKADINKISNLGYIREYDFEKGIKRYCSWLKG